MKPLIRAALNDYLRLGIATPGGVPLLSLSGQAEIDGALLNGPQTVAILNQLTAANAANDQLNYATSAGASLTLTSVQNLVQTLSNGGAVTVTLDYAYNIISQVLNPFVGQSFGMVIATAAATTVATPTLSDTAVTLAGTSTAVLAASARWYQWSIQQVTTTTGSAVTAGTTFTSLTQVGSTNAFTVALGTNAIVPTVGNLFYLGVTAGTLPPGWYPIVKKTSATSFVIATPPGTVWTATAATVPGTLVAPTPVFSPLITLTGMFALVVSTASL